MFSQVCVCWGGGERLPHLHSIIILPLFLSDGYPSDCPQVPFHRGTPVPGRGYSSHRWGYPSHRQGYTGIGVHPSQDETGYLNPRWGGRLPQSQVGVPQSQLGVPLARTGLGCSLPRQSGQDWDTFAPSPPLARTFHSFSFTFSFPAVFDSLLLTTLFCRFSSSAPEKEIKENITRRSLIVIQVQVIPSLGKSPLRKGSEYF